MSTNSIDYSDNSIDAGGDSAYDSSNYGTTTGDLSSSSKDQGDLGSGDAAKSPSLSTGGSGLRTSNQDVYNHEQWGKNEGHAGKLGGDGSESSEAPVGEGMSAQQTQKAQGYTKTNDSNPEIGG